MTPQNDTDDGANADSTETELTIGKDMREHDPLTGELAQRRLEVSRPQTGPRLILFDWEPEHEIYVLDKYDRKTSTPLGSGITLTQEEVKTIYLAAQHAVDTHDGEIRGAALFPGETVIGMDVNDLEVQA